MTREELIEKINLYPKHISTEDIIMSLANEMLINNPHIVPRFMEQLHMTLDYIYNNLLGAVYASKERAWYLSTYLDGRMYPEEMAKQPEYIQIQKGHADYIMKRCGEALGHRKEI